MRNFDERRIGYRFQGLCFFARRTDSTDENGKKTLESEKGPKICGFRVR